MLRSRSRLFLTGVLLCSMASLTLAGDLPLKGVYKSKQSARETEDAILRADLEDMRAVFARTGLYVFVAESRGAWDRDVAPGLDDALSTSPEALDRFARALPSTVTALGPRIGGARVSFELPVERGRGAVAVHLPPLIKQGSSELGLLNSRVPNQGRFLSALDVKREKDDDGDRLVAVYAPSRPRPMDAGRAPSTRPRDLPGKGRGDKVLWAGRAASGSDAEDYRDELRGWIGRDDLPTQPMRSFPGKDDELARSLRSMRVATQVVASDEGWYRALSTRPDSWELDRRKVKHPTRYVAGTAPITAVVDVDGREQARELIIGFVGLYSRLLLTPEEAPLAAGVDGKAFFTAVHEGEVPFLRDRDDVWFLRAHLLRWADGDAKRPDGKARTFREAVDTVRRWGDRYRVRGVDRITRGALPFRYQAIPSDELEEMVDRRRAARGRVFSEDLAAWVKHYDRNFEKGDLDPAYALPKRRDAVSVRASLGIDAGPRAVVTRERAPEPDRPAEAESSAAGAEGGGDAVAAAEPSKGEGGLVKASDLGYGGSAEEGGLDVDLDLDDRGWENDTGGSTATTTYGIESGRMGGSVGGSSVGPEGVLGVAIRDLYTASSVCRVGSVAEAGVEVRISGLPEGELSDLRIEWDLMQDGRSLRRDAFEERRENGVHELEFEVDCPDGGSTAELVVLAAVGDEGRTDEGTLELSVRSAGGRSYSKLSMPSAKRCLSADLEIDSDEDFGMATSMGLTGEQIGEAVRSFQEQTLRCYDSAPEAAGTVQVELTVGCDGRVSAVELIDETIGDSDFVECVVDVMRYAPFPAHDREGGVVFELPLRYE
ncbi:MAG: AgmX/PglI C-terminal domain-containing protein [Deltaproteobacteria bacterium]|nr:AgmX/PglI C-terminal domain-containing protein [Deltaproteobacteria bacterium]